MAVEVRERATGREIDIVIHRRDLVTRKEPARRASVRSGSGCRERSRLGNRRQREHALCRRGPATVRGLAGSCALLRVRRGARGLIARSAALLLRAEWQSDKRAHHESRTPIAHLFLLSFSAGSRLIMRPPVDHSLATAGSTRRVATVPFLPVISSGHFTPHPCPYAWRT